MAVPKRAMHSNDKQAPILGILSVQGCSIINTTTTVITVEHINWHVADFKGGTAVKCRRAYKAENL